MIDSVNKTARKAVGGHPSRLDVNMGISGITKVLGLSTSMVLTNVRPLAASQINP